MLFVIVVIFINIKYCVLILLSTLS